MRLNELIHNLPLAHECGPADTELTDLTDDSRAAAPGSLFIARPGVDGDALRFVPDALAQGAAALILPSADASAIRALSLPDTIALVLAQPGVAIDQRLCGTLAERFFDHPSRKLKLIGVTGTNGKTTVATITQHLINHAGHACGLIGIVSLDTGDAKGPRPATLTTPGAIELSRLLAEMVTNGCSCCAMEVSSHALDQGRVAHVRFAAAAFTNLTQDHLDYHGDMQRYADAKALLFEGLDEDAVAVLNWDDQACHRMAEACKAKVVHTRIQSEDDYGPTPDESITPSWRLITPVQMTASYSKAMFGGPWPWFTAIIPMPGQHNLHNALQAATLAHCIGLNAEQISVAIESCRPVAGRLEPVGPNWPHADAERSEASGTELPTVLVDYAHTPDALENVGRSIRDLLGYTGVRLITVFGCGGDRDRAKRPLMAQAAQRYADVVVLTSDNPRTEDPQQILKDTEAGFAPHADAEPREASGTDHHTIPDRAEAIRFAIGLANANDTVLIAGKGHEDYQIIGTENVHFDDREHAAAALRAKQK